MQIVLDEKGIALLAGAVSSLLVAAWRVSAASKKIEEVDKLKAHVEQMEEERTQDVEAVERLGEIVTRLSGAVDVICLHLGISIRLRAQQSSSSSPHGQQEPARESAAPPEPAPRRYEALVGPADPFAGYDGRSADGRNAPPPRLRDKSERVEYPSPTIHRGEDEGGDRRWPSDEVPTRPEGPRRKK